jgi:hypothetical protein
VTCIPAPWDPAGSDQLRGPNPGAPPGGETNDLQTVGIDAHGEPSTVDVPATFAWHHPMSSRVGAGLYGVDLLARGFGQLESPRWHDGRLWFADWTAGEMRRLGAVGQSEVIVEHRSLPLCFDFLPDGALVLASGPGKHCCVCASTAT